MGDIDWSELPNNAACIICHSDYSGMDLCYIDQSKGLCRWEDGDPVSLIDRHLVAINPKVSMRAFGRATQLNDYKHILEQNKIISSRGENKGTD